MPDTPLDQHDAALVLATLTATKDAAAKHLADGKLIAAADYFRPGDRSVVPDPEGGDQLGLVWMTRPKPVAEIVDRAAFTAWAQQERPDDVETVGVIPSANLDAAIAVVYEHAPHLVEDVTRVTEQGQAAALRDATKKNADPIPGVEVRTPRGSITVKLDEGGADRIRALVAAGRVDPLRALPSPTTQEGAA